MSTGAVFLIIANDGKADKMIMATDLLRQRIEQVKCARRAARDKGLAGYDDDTPTLVDVERSHILYVNAHFKPFAAIGYEYQKVGPQTGTPAWRADLTYSIPQFGDFFYDMVLHLKLDAVSSSSVDPAVALTGSAGTPGGPPDHSDVVNSNVRTVVHSRYIAPDGTVLWDPAATSDNPCSTDVSDPANRSDYVHYCEFPAMRTVTQVQFQVNGNPLDDYNSNTYSFYEKFRIRAGKRTGWNRSVGQEIPIAGYSDLCVSSDARGITGSAGDFSRRLVQVVNGQQTPKPTQPAQEWWLKLLLWFNEDVRLAVPSVSIPYGQRFINIKINQQNEVVFTSGAGFLWEQKTTTITYGDTSVGAVVTNAFAECVNVVCERQPVLLGSTLDETAQRFTAANLYVNNIFVNPEIHDIYIKRIGFNLIRVHRTQSTFVNSDNQEVLLSQLKWPIEYFYAGLRPTENDAPTNAFRWRNWHRFVKATRRVCVMPSTVETMRIPVPTGDGATGVPLDLTTPANVTDTYVSYTGCDDAVVYWTHERTIDRLTVSAHQIPIYKDIPSGFFNSHIPFQFGGVNINTPDDEGALMINFCLYPGTYQPSGHFNISRAREFFFEYTSSVINNVDTGRLIIDASALNFLLISDGSAVLRYST